MYAPIAACDAVIVEVPAPITLIVFPEIVTTFVLEEVKTHGAGELVVGGTRGIVPIPYVVVIIGKDPRIVNVAWAGANGTPMAKSEITTANNEIRCDFFIFLGKEATDEVNIIALSSIFKAYLGFRECGLCEIRAKK